MQATDWTAARAFVDAALERWLPRHLDEAWVARTADPPRFGWDMAALDAGFSQPFHDYARRHGERLRPLLALRLIDALGGDHRRHACALAALEIGHVAALVVNGMRNGRSLAEAAAEDIAVPLPVLVTVAYTARQLAPVLVFRHAEALDGAARAWLGGRFTRQLFFQGLGSVLDFWGAQNRTEHQTVAELVEHLHWHVAPMTFALAADTASAALGWAGQAPAEELARAAAELGVAYRLRQLARRLDGGQPERGEVEVRWHALAPGVGAAALREAAGRAQQTALAQAAAVAAPAAAVFAAFDDAFLTGGMQ